MQTVLDFQGDKLIELIKLPLDELKISFLNPRCIRSDSIINELSESMQLNGYDPLKPIRVHKVNEHYAIFAGGTRFLAAQKANINPIPTAVYKGYSKAEIWKLAYVDNEEEGKYQSLTPYDIWADYARHYNSGQTQTEIARILDTKQPVVSYRIKLFEFAEEYPKILDFICHKDLTEEKLRLITTLYVDIYFSKWLIMKDLWFKVAKYSCGISTSETKEEVNRWKDIISFTEKYYQELPETDIKREYKLEDNKEVCIETKYNPKEYFIEKLAEKEPDTKRKVQNIINQLKDEQLKSSKEYETFLKKQMNKVESERQKQEDEEHRRQEQEFFYPRIFCQSSEDMNGTLIDIDDDKHIIQDESIALVVTSPPYNIGKLYDKHNDLQSWSDYENMLKLVFSQCYNKLMIGGRIAVNVPNIACQEGEKPIFILFNIFNILKQCGFQDREILTWVKVELGAEFTNRMDALAFDTTAWGSWQSSSNPVMRSLSEFIIIMHKVNPKMECDKDSDLTKDEFMNWTRNVWFIPSVSSSKHPTIYPEELPHRLIKLFSFPNQIVLDPFAGIGITGVAAIKNKRRFIGFDISESYCREGLNAITSSNLFK